NDVAPPRAATVSGSIIVVVARCNRARGEQIHPRRGSRGRGRSLQEIAPPELRTSMVLRFSFIAQLAHFFPSSRVESAAWLSSRPLICRRDRRALPCRPRR